MDENQKYDLFRMLASGMVKQTILSRLIVKPKEEMIIEEIQEEEEEEENECYLNLINNTKVTRHEIGLINFLASYLNLIKNDTFYDKIIERLTQKNKEFQNAVNISSTTSNLQIKIKNLKIVYKNILEGAMRLFESVGCVVEKDEKDFIMKSSNIAVDNRVDVDEFFQKLYDTLKIGKYTRVTYDIVNDVIQTMEKIM